MMNRERSSPSLEILVSTKGSTYTHGSTGGAESSLRLIAEKLAGRGHNVTYLTKGDFTWYGWKTRYVNGVRVLFHPDLKRLGDRRPTRGVGRYIRSLTDRMNSFWFDFLVRWKVPLGRIDIVHVYDQTSLLRYFVAKRKSGARFRIVMRMAGLLWYKEILQGPEKKRIYREIFDELDAVNYISGGLKRIAAEKAAGIGFELGFRHSFVGDIGVDLDALPKRRRSKTPGHPFRIVVATRFSLTQKRHDLLVEAIRLVDRNIPLEVVMIGDGPREAAIRKMIREYELDGIIHLEPFRTQEELWSEMLSADLLCHPTDYEGLGKIVVESMALGLPVLASDVLPLNNYIKDGATGFLVENTPAAWAKRLTAIIGDAESLKGVSEASKEWAHRHLDAEKCVELYENEFRRLLPESRNPGE